MSNVAASLHKKGVRIVSLLAAVAALGIAVLAAPAPSQGHNATVWVTHPGGGSASVTNHLWMKVCDWQVDGHKVYMRYRAYGADDTLTFGYAPSGGCTGVTKEPRGRWISTFVACVQYEGCSRPEVP